MLPFITASVWDRASGVLDVEASVPNLVEIGGTCTLTATNGGMTLRATVTASPGASDTECNPIQLTASQVRSGTWTVAVVYSSKKSYGVSAAHSVQVTK